TDRVRLRTAPLAMLPCATEQRTFFRDLWPLMPQGNIQSAKPRFPETVSHVTSSSSVRTRYLHVVIASEISAVTRYYDRVIHWMPRHNDNGSLFANVDTPIKQLIEGDDQFPDLTSEQELRTAILVNGTFNHHFDIQGLLLGLKPKLSRTSR